MPKGSLKLHGIHYTLVDHIKPLIQPRLLIQFLTTRPVVTNMEARLVCSATWPTNSGEAPELERDLLPGILVRLGQAVPEIVLARALVLEEVLANENKGSAIFKSVTMV
jgi:hypothetical protein